MSQNEAFLRMAQTLNSGHVLTLQSEVSRLASDMRIVERKIEQKKRQLTDNMEKANGVQKEIHEFIQFNPDKIPKNLGCQALVQLWEFHLVKVQSYFAEHSNQALQQAHRQCQRQLQLVSGVTEQLVELATSNENLPPSVKTKLDELVGSLLDGEKGKKKGGVMWADTKSTDHPTSDLFPSPQLVQPQSPQLSFTPGKTLVGSTPQLNKLQNAYVHGEGFNTPAPPKLQACFRARFNTPDKNSERVNLKDRFAEVSSILKSPKQPDISLSDDEEAGQSLNSTFTLGEPIKKPPPPSAKRPVTKRKMSMIPAPMSMQPKRNTLVSPFPPKTAGTSGVSQSGHRKVPRTTVGRPTTSTLKRPTARAVPKVVPKPKK
eukprot:sb/3465771/